MRGHGDDEKRKKEKEEEKQNKRSRTPEAESKLLSKPGPQLCQLQAVDFDTNHKTTVFSSVK